MARKKFGEILIEAGAVDETTLEKALSAQQGSGKRLGQVLEEMGAVTERHIAVVLSRQFGFKTVKGISKYRFPPELLQMTDGETALEKLVFPLKQQGKTLFLAMVNPLDIQAIDDFSFRTGCHVIPCVTTPSEIHEAVNRHYPRKGGSDDVDWWNILVVDDQEMVRAAIQAALNRDGFSVTQAANGAEGLKAVLQNTFHLVITDTVMPRMDGYEMFRILQENPQARNIPVIALSSKASAEEEASLLDMGYFDFIAKPINPVRLVARTRRALKWVYGDVPPAA